ncbi:MAG: DUF523 domain-containing protein [Syntrophomonadaceae bacterium]|nr:DUF523 domain-containing protein [Syntrophomonadaceae bacterium]
MRLISACLCGINCKHNGGNNLNPYFLDLLRRGELIPVCPEQLGGLSTPRIACEITGGTGADLLKGHALALTRDGKNVTAGLLKGARETLSIAVNAGIEEAIMKSRSPSCGNGFIYDGTFTGKLIDGEGVTTALLKQNGIRIWNEQEYLREKGGGTASESS